MALTVGDWTNTGSLETK